MASTLTFCECAENHVRNQQFGVIGADGLDLGELIGARDWFIERGIDAMVYDLRSLLPEELRAEAEEAYLLVAPGGANVIDDGVSLLGEQNGLEKDKHAFMYGRVVNKLARHNLCFGDQAQAPNYELGMGTMVPFTTVPHLNSIRERLPEIFGAKATNLLAEGNYYYDVTKCGIGWHGDSERRIVIGLRLGVSIPLCYRWYKWSAQVGETGRIEVPPNSIYAMSEKAVGTDWKLKKVLTLRHAAGSDKYTA